MELYWFIGYFTICIMQIKIFSCKELATFYDDSTGTIKNLEFLKEISWFKRDEDIIFIIISQKDLVHEQKAITLEEDLNRQTKSNSKVYLTHRDLKHVGDWTIIPLIERLWRIHEKDFVWMFFLSDNTKVNITNLISSIQQYSDNETFIGRAIQDLEPTIIHHFKSVSEFKYPLFASGFGFNHKLLKKLINLMGKKNLKTVDFSIDAAHELALFIMNNLNGLLLINDTHFCFDFNESCATYVDMDNLCDNILDVKEIFFAVKTCKRYHKSRLSIIHSTWAKKAHHIAFFSDSYDESIPTIKLNVRNTDSGHCTKTQAIFKKMREYLTENESLRWVILSDDDTILSVQRLQKLVSCYNSDEPYVLGERYGYNVYSSTGYNYITGGGGAALSRSAILKLSENNCICPSDSTPDDMFLLGICVQRLNITLVHIPQFHQARPNDYNVEYLKIGKPISFHKHWMIDPISVYKQWFESADLMIYKQNMHSEL